MEQQLSEQFKHSVAAVADQLYAIVYKEAKKNLKAEGLDYQTGYERGIADGKEKILKNFPMWKIAPADDYVKETVLAGAGEFGLRLIYRGQLIKAGWKYIPIKSLKLLAVEMPEEETNNETFQ